MDQVEVEQLIEQIDRQLRAEGTPERAEHEKAYLKSQLRHYGTRVPVIRAAVKTAAKAAGNTAAGNTAAGNTAAGNTAAGKTAAKGSGGLGHDDLLAAAVSLWAVQVHERRMAAVELLRLEVDRLQPSDVGLLERLLRESRTWALVDGLAPHVVGPLVERYEELGDVLDRWAGDDDFWIRRSALLALSVPLRRGQGDFERFGRYADAMLDEKELFVRKAIGWVLRDTAKQRPELVVDWLLPRASRASGVTLREALKPLSEEQRRLVQAAR